MRRRCYARSLTLEGEGRGGGSPMLAQAGGARSAQTAIGNLQPSDAKDDFAHF